MKAKIKIIVVALIISLLVIVSTLFIVGYFKPLKAGVLIQSNPGSVVYIDGIQRGSTPYEGTYKPGEVVIKLIPDSIDKPLIPYETKVRLVSGVKTIIQRNFADSEDKISGAIISFERIPGSEMEISVVSEPDNVSVSIDGQVRGNTPYKTSAIGEGIHTLTLAAKGYEEKTLEVRNYRGFGLTAVFKLAVTEGKTLENPTPLPKVLKEERKLTILPTSTGFLRVRKEPSTLADEVGEVQPGSIYVLLDTDEETGWYKIEYEKGKEGWISNTYAKEISFIEAGTSVTPLPTTTTEP